MPAIQVGTRRSGWFAAALAALSLAIPLAILGAIPGAIPGAAAQEPSGKPIVIGFSMAETGSLAVNGKSGLLAMKIWAEDQNKKGGLLGRPVKLDFYDDQTNPSLVPGIYTKLLDVDKVDLVISGYGTNIAAPAMPVIIAHKMAFIGLFALDINEEFKYPNYFSMLPVGPDPRPAISEGFFDIIKQNKDKLGLKTIALATGDGEATRNSTDGARINLKKAGLQIVYDKTYPLNTTDFSPVVRALQASNADVVYISSYPADSVGIIRSVNELGLKTKVFGGNLTGPQSTALKTSLGPMLNGIITFDWWLPAPSLRFPGVMEFLKEYQARAAKEGVDPLGYYLGPWAYADLQVLGEAVEGTKSLDQQKIADYIREHTFKTVVGDVKFGKKGEWATSRILTVQFQHIKGTSVDDFRDGKGETVLWPDKYKAGDAILPYTAARQ
ncbi:MAG TPA: amino acid ABC transporter substrate-binding protein [Stellaceae bacterium]|nr:amino acid ABC transporter substrate-binding protein [Stellaceae bacterium]